MVNFENPLQVHTAQLLLVFNQQLKLLHSDQADCLELSFKADQIHGQTGSTQIRKSLLDFWIQTHFLNFKILHLHLHLYFDLHHSYLKNLTNCFQKSILDLGQANCQMVYAQKDDVHCFPSMPNQSALVTCVDVVLHNVSIVLQQLYVFGFFATIVVYLHLRLKHAELGLKMLFKFLQRALRRPSFRIFLTAVYSCAVYPLKKTKWQTVEDKNLFHSTISNHHYPTFPYFLF